MATERPPEHKMAVLAESGYRRPERASGQSRFHKIRLLYVVQSMPEFDNKPTWHSQRMRKWRGDGDRFATAHKRRSFASGGAKPLARRTANLPSWSKKLSANIWPASGWRALPKRWKRRLQQKGIREENVPLLVDEVRRENEARGR